MRVLHVTYGVDPSTGGTLAVLVGLATAQAAAGLDVTVLATDKWGRDTRVVQDLSRHGIEVEVIGPTRTALAWHPSLSRRVDARVRTASVVHAHGLYEQVQYVAARAARRHGVPFIVCPHGMLSPWSLQQSRLRKRLYLQMRLRSMLDGAAALHFTSTAEEEMARPLHLRAPGIVEPNGIDVAEFQRLPPRGELRTRLGLADERPIVLFLGRLHHKKGLDLLVPAFATGAPPEAVLVVAGPNEGGARERMTEAAEALGIADRLVFTGMLDRRDRLLALVDADLFVLPSYNENFGVAVVEALAAGTPVVVSDQVGIHEEIAAAGVGSVVPCDAGALAREIGNWITQPVRRQEASARARRFALERFDWHAIARRWGEHYAMLAAGETPRFNVSAESSSAAREG